LWSTKDSLSLLAFSRISVFCSIINSLKYASSLSVRYVLKGFLEFLKAFAFPIKPLVLPIFLTAVLVLAVPFFTPFLNDAAAFAFFRIDFFFDFVFTAPMLYSLCSF